MEMEQPFVVSAVGTAFASRLDMIDFHEVSILKVQFTPTTFSPLLLEQSRFRLMHQWMGFQALAPVEQVSIIGTGGTLHFLLPLDNCFPLHSPFFPSLGRTHPPSLLPL